MSYSLFYVRRQLFKLSAHIGMSYQGLDAPKKYAVELGLL